MKNLIIKLGALGDVVRTTVLLGELEGEVHWLSKKNARPLLKSSKIFRSYFVEDYEDIKRLKELEYSLIISLDEEINTLKILKDIKTKKLIGAYLNNSCAIDYTPDSAHWFDMSMVSKFGKQRADELKQMNEKSVPVILINMLRKEFHGQEYDIGIKEKNVKERIGLINTYTGVWPNKQWKNYSELFNKLNSEGYDVTFLKMRATLEEHIEDINNCRLVVCGDTLGMHLSLAFKKNVVALFNCTSPQEIEDYGRLKKVVSPLYKKYFYEKQFNEEAVSAIGMKEVYSMVKTYLKDD